jgi:hypothetical protein
VNPIQKINMVENNSERDRGGKLAYENFTVLFYVVILTSTRSEKNHYTKHTCCQRVPWSENVTYSYMFGYELLQKIIRKAMR